MKNARLILILSAGVIAVVVALLPLRHQNNSIGGRTDYDQPLPGRASFVAAPDLVAAPGQFHRKRVVLNGIWRRGFEQSSLEVVEGQGFFIWVELWNSKEFAAEAGEFFERVSTDDDDLAAPAPIRIRAEGSFYYRSHADGGGFGHLGHAEALFLVDRILLLERIQNREPNAEVSASAAARNGNSAEPARE